MASECTIPLSGDTPDGASSPRTNDNRPTNLDLSGVEYVQEGKENYQGPHDWRKRLRPVQSPIKGVEESESVGDQKVSTDERPRPSRPLPPWKRDLIEKNKKVARLVRRESSGRSKRAPIVRRESSGRSKKAAGNESPSGVSRKKSLKGENSFTQQVVNENSGSRRHVSPANSFKSASGVRRTPSDKVLDPNDPNTKKRIERVRRARLYLLQQIGPNSFLIVGDSPEHKFRVIIGPQTCSCGKGSNCVHVLFVMLRVFQVSEGDPYLWSKQLKNYEVESLFRVYNDKRSQRIEAKKSRRSRRPSPDRSQVPSPEEKLPSGSDVGSVREEEDMCSICLLEMVEGESLLKCNFCQNRLHHHCITVWFDECKRQHDPLICPLCRTRWKQSVEEVKAEEAGADPPPLVPPNTRAPSPQMEAESTRLPYAEPIPGEYINMSLPWIEILGEDLVACLFSRNWSIRETGLKHMGQEMRRDLLQVTRDSQPGGHSAGAHTATISLENMNTMLKILQCCFSVVSFMCQDPVYKVFVACLKVLHIVFAVLPSRDNRQRDKLQTLLHPVINAIIVKCTDGNRRTSQLSISTMVELAKGQNGELALGRDLTNTGMQGLGGMSYLVGCLTEKYRCADISWQWLLGRLYVIEKLVAEFPTEFLPRQRPDGASSESSLDIGASAFEEEKPLNYYMLIRVAEFSVGAVSNRHARISRVARRVFLMCVRYSAHLENLTAELGNMLNDLNLSYRKSMKRQLQKIVAEFQLTQKINCLRHDGVDSDNSTPEGTPLSTPRCPSPVTTVSDCPSEAGSDNRNSITAPPNTPIRNKRQRLVSTERSRKSFDFVQESDLCGSTSTMKAAKSLDSLDTVCKPRKSRLSKSPVVKKGKCRSRSNTPQRIGPVLETNLDDVIKLQEELNRSSTSGHDLNVVGDDEEDGLTLDSPTLNLSPTAYDAQVPSPRLLSHDLETDIDSVELNLDDIFKVKLNMSGDSISPETPQGRSEKSRNPKAASRTLSASPVNKPSKLRTFISLDLTKDSHERMRKVRSPSVQVLELDRPPEGAGSNQIPPFNALSSTPKSSRCTQQGAASQSTDPLISNTSQQNVSVNSANSSKLSEASYVSSPPPQAACEDMMMNMATTPCVANEKPVTFRSEVAMGTPKHSPSHTLDNEEEDCLCKEEVEREEALALAKAMEISSKDLPMPIVPGLTPHDQEQVISIRIQPDDCDAVDSNGNPPILYYENIHWKKGSLLGTGAFSTCYQARDVKTGTIMALKQISFCRNSRSEQEKVIESITEEIHMMSKLDHPHIVRIMGATRQGCHFNMFAEWMPGGSVSNLLSLYGAFSEGVMTNYVLQILRGLAYLHDNHILHRDLKGANLLVDGTGRRLRIGDFGSAARLASKATGAGEFQGQLLGTIAFMAPEVLRGENYGRACDVWSVGCCMIEMATTKPPWNTHDVSNHLALIFKIANAESTPPIPEKLSPPVRDILLRCLEPMKEQRPTAKDLLIHPLFTQYMESMM